MAANVRSRATGASWIVVIFILLRFMAPEASDTVELCPPVLEGKPLTLTCAGNTEHELREIYWLVYENETSDYEALESCLEMKNVCKENSELSVINSHTGLSFVSNVTFKDVTADYRDKLYGCYVYDYGPEEMNLYLKCKMNTYTLPSLATNCSATALRGMRSIVTCTDIDMYPGFGCRVRQDKSDKYVEASTSEGTCSVTQVVDTPGDYRYNIEVYPARNNQRIGSGVLITTGNIVIVPDPIIILFAPDTVHLCPKNDTLVTCSAMWFEGQISPEVDIDGFKLGSPQMEKKIKRFGDKDYQSTLVKHKLHLNSSYEVKTISCFAPHNSNVRDSKEISINWPPKSPNILSQDGVPLGENNFLSDFKNTLECVAEGGHPLVSHVQILCWSPTETLVSLTSKSNSITFLLQANVTEHRVISCKCTASHPSPCYESTRSISLGLYSSEVVRSRSSINSSSSSSTANSIKSMLMWVVPGVLLFVLVPVIVGVMAHIKKKWPDLYTYVYSSILPKKKTNDRRQRSDYELVDTSQTNVKEAVSPSERVHGNQSDDDDLDSGPFATIHTVQGSENDEESGVLYSSDKRSGDLVNSSPRKPKVEGACVNGMDHNTYITPVSATYDEFDITHPKTVHTPVSVTYDESEITHLKTVHAPVPCNAKQSRGTPLPRQISIHAINADIMGLPDKE